MASVLYNMFKDFMKYCREITRKKPKLEIANVQMHVELDKLVVDFDVVNNGEIDAENPYAEGILLNKQNEVLPPIARHTCHSIPPSAHDSVKFHFPHSVDKKLVRIRLKYDETTEAKDYQILQHMHY